MSTPSITDPAEATNLDSAAETVNRYLPDMSADHPLPAALRIVLAELDRRGDRITELEAERARLREGYDTTRRIEEALRSQRDAALALADDLILAHRLAYRVPEGRPSAGWTVGVSVRGDVADEWIARRDALGETP